MNIIFSRLTQILISGFLVIGASVSAQVSLPTGSVDLGFPLFEYQDENRLTFKINLGYKCGNGIPVDEMASNVGLGWDLLAGGFISRQVMGEPDDQNKLNTTTSIYNGYLYTEYSPNRAPNPGMGFSMLAVNGFQAFNSEMKDDRLQDIFTFNINGQVGTFVIGQNGEIKTLNQSRYRISKTETDMTASKITTRISQFTITDDNGTQYIFKDLSTSRLYDRPSIGAVAAHTTGGEVNTYFSRQSGTLKDWSIVSTWHLSEIVNPFTGKKITISYVDSHQEYLSSSHPTKMTKTIDGETDQTILVIDNQFKGVVKTPKTIQLPGDVKIELSYNPIQRVDLAGAGALQKISVIRGINELYAYNFTYNYFSKADLRAENYSFPTDEKPYARLCLQSFWKSGRNGAVERPYIFTYAKAGTALYTDWVPRRASNSKDFWGFYNTIQENPITTTNIYTIAGSHYMNFDKNFHWRLKLPYNHPTRIPGTSGYPAVAQNGMIKTITTPNGGKTTYTYEANVAAGPDGPEIIGGVRLKSVEVSDGMPGSSPITTTYRYLKSDNTTSGWGYEDPIFQQSRQTIMVTPSSTTGLNISSTVSMIAGTASQIQMLRSLNKLYGFDNLNERTVNGYLSVALNLYMYLRMIFAGNQTTNFTVNSESPIGYANVNPLPKMYSRVEVLNGTETDYDGKTVYEFTSPTDLPLLRITPAAPFSNKPRYFPWAYGLTKRISNFNNDNQLTSETIHEFEFHSEIPLVAGRE